VPFEFSSLHRKTLSVFNIIIEPKSGKNITENRLSGTKIRFVRQNRSEKPVSKSVQIFAKILYD